MSASTTASTQGNILETDFLQEASQIHSELKTKCVALTDHNGFQRIHKQMIRIYSKYNTFSGCVVPRIYIIVVQPLFCIA